MDRDSDADEEEFKAAEWTDDDEDNIGQVISTTQPEPTQSSSLIASETSTESEGKLNSTGELSEPKE